MLRHSALYKLILTSNSKTAVSLSAERIPNPNPKTTKSTKTLNLQSSDFAVSALSLTFERRTDKHPCLDP